MLFKVSMMCGTDVISIFCRPFAASLVSNVWWLSKHLSFAYPLSLPVALTRNAEYHSREFHVSHIPAFIKAALMTPVSTSF